MLNDLGILIAVSLLTYVFAIAKKGVNRVEGRYFSFVIYWVYGVYHITIEKVSGYPDTFFGDKKVQLIA